MLYFETLFQKILVHHIPSSPMQEENQLGFIYIVPLHVFEFCSAIVTIDLASKLSSEENNSKLSSLMSLKQMFQNSIDFDISIMKSTFITSLY
jgi:hypothetical protein